MHFLIHCILHIILIYYSIKLVLVKFICQGIFCLDKPRQNMLEHIKFITRTQIGSMVTRHKTQIFPFPVFAILQKKSTVLTVGGSLAVCVTVGWICDLRSHLSSAATSFMAGQSLLQNPLALMKGIRFCEVVLVLEEATIAALKPDLKCLFSSGLGSNGGGWLF